MQPMIFLNVSWMSKYEGLFGDTISGGFGYVALHGYGSEIFNFKPHKGKMYGFARAPRNSIRLEKLGAVNGATSVYESLPTMKAVELGEIPTICLFASKNGSRPAFVANSP